MPAGFQRKAKNTIKGTKVKAETYKKLSYHAYLLTAILDTHHVIRVRLIKIQNNNVNIIFWRHMCKDLDKDIYMDLEFEHR